MEIDTSVSRHSRWNNYATLVRGAVLSSVERNTSRYVVHKESKSEYWKKVVDSVPMLSSGQKISGNELNSVICRAMSLGIVGDRKQRESMLAPKADDLLKQMKDQMEQKIKELTGKSINVKSIGAQDTLIDKVLCLENILSNLEVKKAQEEEEEKHKINSKLIELEGSLDTLKQKNEQKNLHRKLMMMDIANLKRIAIMQQNTSDVNKSLSQKIECLDVTISALQQDKMNKIEDQKIILLKRKLALFEQKLKNMGEEKKFKVNVDMVNLLHDKLTLMEEKLIKMENSKIMVLSQLMQQKMESVEKQLSTLKSEISGNHNDAVNSKIQEEVISLEKQLGEIATAQKITPSLINDEETVALRKHIKKIELHIIKAEKRIEEQKQKLDEEKNYERRLAMEIYLFYDRIFRFF